MSYPYQIKSLEQYHQVYRESIENPEAFWTTIAEHFRWKQNPERTLQWNFKDPEVKWFEGGTLNITENCLDRWAETQPHTAALIWESNDPEEHHRILSYKELLFKVNQFSNVLKNNGAKKGDRICIYMPMVPELAIAVLACARIGAIHSVVFGGFSAQSIADRINDAQCNIVITADGGYRGNKEIPLKNVIDDALVQCPSVQRVIVLTRTRIPVSMIKGRDTWWEDEIRKVETSGNPFVQAEEMKAEDPLFILYTSGSTGKPKGVVHSCAGYMIYTNYTFVNVFQYQPGELHFCTADIGWITGHSYILYGPLSAGATSLMFEGIPTWPDAGRFWDIVDKFKVNILYTAPTAIRSLMVFGTELIDRHDLSSLKVLGSVGEPINEEAWHWFDQHIGKGRCPIVDTWWQTETGGIMISNLAGITPQKPAHATYPLPGVQPILVDEQGNKIPGGDASALVLPSETISGNLCIQFPWPSIIRTTYGDHERCRTTYFSTYDHLYFTGDGCLRDAEGNYRITGRVDDVLNVSGHRIGTAEVENAINMHTGVVESAIVGYPHDIKGQGIYAYVIFNGHIPDKNLVAQDIHQTVSRIIGAIAKPDKIQFVSALPKTRSGKIMRRILRKIAEGDVDNLGDISTLFDPAVVEEIKMNRL
ncbi:MAG: acetate--CoA ligase [Chitinophagaceae bacterium]|nr:acetate--CoA ligase [Chitinophagaceae bacterium]